MRRWCARRSSAEPRTEPRPKPSGTEDWTEPYRGLSRAVPRNGQSGLEDWTEDRAERRRRTVAFCAPREPGQTFPAPVEPLWGPAKVLTPLEVILSALAAP
ncbi:hypothetical protein ACFOLD_04670 [Kocuria carniphila]|uniref:hypothetical protein n=1 Tax=Kocuria carniphila TaxID=262208 RepID=UPI00361E2C05